MNRCNNIFLWYKDFTDPVNITRQSWVEICHENVLYVIYWNLFIITNKIVVLFSSAIIYIIWCFIEAKIIKSFINRIDSTNHIILDAGYLLLQWSTRFKSRSVPITERDLKIHSIRHFQLSRYLIEFGAASSVVSLTDYHAVDLGYIPLVP